jgi:HPt (histidine-containing phosphotransfer) domain-containing protein
MVDDREKCIAAGMDDYVAKPVKGGQLEVVLNRWIGAAPAAGRHITDGLRGAETEAVLDLHQLAGLRELCVSTGDPDFLRDLVDTFLTEVGLRLGQLQALAQGGDMAAVGEVAHGMKGTSGAMGATLAASACAVLEAAAGAGRVGPEELAQVSAELERAVIALRAQVP